METLNQKAKTRRTDRILMNKNILIITSEFPPQPGGIGNHALNLSLQLQKNGYKVTVITDQRDKNIDHDMVFDSTLEIQVVRICRKVPPFLTYLNRFGTAFPLIKNKDLILASGKFSLWLVGFYSLFFRSKKYIAVLHGSELGAGGKWGRKMTAWSLKRFEKLIAVSNFTRDLALNISSDLDIKVINNGYFPKANTPITFPRDSNLNVITVGNVTLRKGQQNVIKALPLIKSKYPDIKYHVVGLPTEKKIFSDLAKKLDVEDAVIFHGAVSNEKLQKQLASANVFFMLSDHLSNGDVEGFGIAVLEANDHFLPAIGSRNSGIADAIKDGYSGKLVDPHNPQEILDALEAIMADYENYAHQAKKWSEGFYWENVIQEYLKVMEI